MIFKAIKFMFVVAVIGMVLYGIYLTYIEIGPEWSFLILFFVIGFIILFVLMDDKKRMNI